MFTTGQLRVIAISDTHGMHKRIDIPPGDVFIHAGDFTPTGTLAEVAAFGAWVRELPHRYKLVVAGNHDVSFEDDPERARLALGDGDGLIYLEDSGINIEGVAFWGSPWQPEFMDWSFNLPRGPRLAERWARIPVTTDVLITHGPPSGILDIARGEHVGCADLRHRIRELRIKAHIFGHIHGSSGVTTSDEITYVNAAICDDDYFVSNPARRVDVLGAQSIASIVKELIGREVYVRWRTMTLGEAMTLGEDGLDEGVFKLHDAVDGVLTLFSDMGFEDVRITDVIAISEARCTKT